VKKSSPTISSITAHSKISILTICLQIDAKEFKNQARSFQEIFIQVSKNQAFLK